MRILDPVAVAHIEKKYGVRFTDEQKEEALQVSGFLPVKTKDGFTQYIKVDLINFPNDLLSDVARRPQEESFYDLLAKLEAEREAQDE